jgi:endonuclease G
VISNQGETQDWVSLDLNSQISQTTGNVGSPIYLYLQENSNSFDRTATIDVTFSDNFHITLTLTQTAYAVDADYDRAWAEQPQYRVNNSYIYKTYFTTLVSGARVRSYSICYDTSKRISHWVAYPLHKIYRTPSFSRNDNWGYDPNDQMPVIPEISQQYIGNGTATNQDKNGATYGSGHARGHQIPSADRYNNSATNWQTFYATNMMPQDYNFNGDIWLDLEGAVRNAIVTDTLYVVTGTYFGSSRTITDKKGNTIAVPSNCWKVLLRTRAGNTGKAIKDCTAGELKGIGFWFTNDNNNGSDLAAHATSIADIEAKTGFTFFRNLSSDASDAVKAQNNYKEWW